MKKSFFWLIFLLFIGGCGNSKITDDNNKSKSIFTVFHTTDGLTDDSVTDTAMDYIRNGVWFSTRAGISFYSLTDSVFYNYGPNYDLPDMELTSIAIDYSGTVWAGTVTGLASIAFGDSLWKSLSVTERDSLAHRYITCLSPIDFSLYIGTKGGLNVKSFDLWKSYTTDLGSSAEVTSVAKSSSGDIWVGTTNGLSVYNGSKWTYYSSSVLPSSYVNVVFKDESGKMWVGTSSIAAVYDGVSWTRYGQTDGLAADGINDFLQDKTGVLWAGTNDGVYYFNNGKWIKLALPAVITGAPVRTLAADQRNGTLWIGTDSGVVRYYPNQK